MKVGIERQEWWPVWKVMPPEDDNYEFSDWEGELPDELVEEYQLAFDAFNKAESKFKTEASKFGVRT